MKKLYCIMALLPGILLLQIYMMNKNSLYSEYQVGAIRQAIESETQSQTSEYPWAGSYYLGDGLGVNKRLDISPRSGFAYEHHGCLGLYDRNYGQVKLAADGHLELDFALRNKEFGIADEYTVVTWGERYYLISLGEMERFCQAVKKGMEPRYERRGLFFLRSGDENKEAAGRPRLPEAFLSYLESNEGEFMIGGRR